MKNQYLCDINDYHKYGLLRGVQRHSGLSLGVAWMLTEDDKGTDGGRRGYLHAPDQWRSPDPELFDAMAGLHRRKGRTVGHVDELGVLPGAAMFEELVPAHTQTRQGFFQRLLDRMAGRDVLFFDPDNGVEVASHPPGSRHCVKYVYWEELKRAYERGHSLIVYQHFPRKPRGPYAAAMEKAFAGKLGAHHVESVACSSVLFVVAAQARHAQALRGALLRTRENWPGLAARGANQKTRAQ